MKKITLLCLLLCLISRTFAGSHRSDDGKNNQNDCSANITVNVSWSTICPGGSVTIMASGGATYLWNDGETTATISVSPAFSTLYMVTATDTGGCTGTASSMVNVDHYNIKNEFSYSPTCDGLPIIFTPYIKGGFSPYTFHWQADGSRGATDTITNYSNTAYDYSLWVTDSLGCQFEAPSPYIPRYEFYAFLQTKARFCNDYENPKANVLSPVIVTGKGPFTFSWNTGDSTQAINPNSPGIYSVIITDVMGCSQTFSCNVTFQLAPNVVVTSSSNAILSGMADTLTASGAEEYYWNNGMTTNQIIVSPTRTTNYSVYGWDTTNIHGRGGRFILNGCGSPWEAIPVTISNDPWLPSLNTPFTYTSPIYTLGDVGIGIHVPNYKLEVNGTVAADSTLLIGKVNSGQGIIINGNTATITSPTKTVSFGSDTVVTTGTVKAGSLQVGYFKADSINTGVINVPDSSLVFSHQLAFVFPIGSANNGNSFNYSDSTFASHRALTHGYATIGSSAMIAPLACTGPTPVLAPCGYSINSESVPSAPRVGLGTVDMQAELDIEGAPGGLPGLVVGAGNVGIGTTTPASILDVNGTATNYAGRIANFSNNNSSVFVVSQMPNDGNWNNITQANDNGIFWDDGGGGGNISSGFVIAPHNGPGGIRIDASGTLGIGTSNNSVFVGGAGSINNSNYLTPGFNNPIQSYLGFNLSSNGSGIWQNSSGLGGAAILTDTRGYMNFVSISNGATSGIPDYTMQTNTQMVVSPSGVLIRNPNFTGTGTPIPSCQFDPAFMQTTLTGEGYTGSNFIFFVGGSMTAQELLIQPCSGVWCDYVFDKEYKLTPLKDLERYIMENKHLPDVPSAKEVKEDGIMVGKMDATMLKKIEELTLYIINQQKQIDAMNEEINKLKQGK